ncbi:hypothetical protein DL990_15405 [Amycolatopsis sp. WAC 01416]|nr:hypothetical protein DL990_15405 [Amycolatopsis sp. WAC 01416]
MAHPGHAGCRRSRSGGVSGGPGAAARCESHFRNVEGCESGFRNAPWRGGRERRPGLPRPWG